MGIIKFCSADKRVSLKKIHNLKKVIEQIFLDMSVSYDTVTYIFCSDSFLLRINQQFLNHDTFTDIITFNLTDKSKLPVVGEIYISVDRVRENAFLLGNTYKNEMSRVVFHGALHLCGLKDKKREEKKEMRMTEDYYLKKLESLK